MGYKLPLDSPRTLNEKLQWLKLHDHNTLYTQIVDKYLVRDYIRNRLGEKYLIPLYGVWSKFSDIDFSKLPNQFVLKTNHDSGGIYICRDKKTFDRKSAKQKINKSLKYNFYYFGMEWPYKNVKPKIIAEKYMTDGNGKDGFTDYKFFCFNGYVDCVMVCLDRFTSDTKFYFFDSDWNLKRINKRGKAAPEGFSLPRPAFINEMFQIAQELSKGIPFVRVDLYQSDGQVYFGEMTFYPDSGYDTNLLPETDEYFGKLVDLDLCFKNGKSAEV